MSKRSFILFIVCLLSIGFLQAQPKGMLTYSDKINDFVVDYPDTWELQEGEEGIITIFAPYDDQTEYSEDDQSDQEVTQVEEKIQIVPSRWENSTLEEFANENFLNVSLGDNFRVEKQGTETIGGKEVLWYLTSYETNEVKINCLFYFFKMYNKVISFVAIAGADNFDSKFKPIYLDIIRSTRSYIESRK